MRWTDEEEKRLISSLNQSRQKVPLSWWIASVAIWVALIAVALGGNDGLLVLVFIILVLSAGKAWVKR